LEAWDDRHLWHPFTPQSVYREEEPLLVVGGEGNYLIDVEGRRYLDGVASLWCNAFGHRRPEIDRAVREQLDRIAHATLLGNATLPAIVLARRLAEIAPEPLSRVFFSDDGSTAVEVAVKMAVQYWQQAEGGAQARRTRVLALGEAYHGDTVGSVSLGGIDLFHSRFRPLLFDVVRAPAPGSYRPPEGRSREAHQAWCRDETLRLVAAHGAELAALVLEPGFQGAAGIVPYPQGYVAEVANAARAAGALVIFDEVAAGMGRSGRMFACEREGVTPDLLCLAKMLTGGYLPLAATLATERVYEAFLGPPEEGRTLFHGHTFTGNPLAAAAALAVLDIFERERVLDRLPALVERLAGELGRLLPLPAVGDIRQYGLAAGIELVADRETREPYPPGWRIGPKVCRAARDQGVFLRPLGDVVVLMPPLSVTGDEIARLVGAVEHGIRRVCGA
jgi:adenosylmethionine-8-amino-7-oxononanoate aminotransferase